MRIRQLEEPGLSFEFNISPLSLVKGMTSKCFCKLNCPAALLDQTAKYPETVSRSAAWDWPWLRCLKAYVQHLRSEEVTDDAVTLE